MILLYLIVPLLLLLLTWLYWKQQSWKSIGVRVPPGYPLLGHWSNLSHKKHWLYIDKIYQKYKKHRFWGMYDISSPILYVADVELITDIAKANQNFTIHRNIYKTLAEKPLYEKMVRKYHKNMKKIKVEIEKSENKTISPTTYGKSSSEDEALREFKASLLNKSKPKVYSEKEINLEKQSSNIEEISPSVNDLKIKEVTNLTPEFHETLKLTHENLIKFSPIVDKKLIIMCKKITDELTKTDIVSHKNILNLCYKEIVCSLIFGENDLPPLFAKKTSKLLKFGWMKKMKMWLLFHLPKIASLLKIKISKEVTYFCDLFLQAVIRRRNSSQLHRGDFIEFICKNSRCRDSLTDLNIEALSLIHPGASVTPCFIASILEQLSLQAELQESLRSALSNHQITNSNNDYDVLIRNIIKESSRMFGPLVAVELKCIKDYRIPNSDVTLPRNTLVRIPLYSLHHDDHLFESPDVFNHARWQDSNLVLFDKLFRRNIRDSINDIIVKSSISRITSEFHCQIPESEGEHKKNKDKLIFTRNHHF